MKNKISNRTEIRIAKVSTIIIFLALIRTISEIFRLHYYSQSILTYEKIKPFMNEHDLEANPGNLVWFAKWLDQFDEILRKVGLDIKATEIGAVKNFNNFF